MLFQGETPLSTIQASMLSLERDLRNIGGKDQILVRAPFALLVLPKYDQNLEDILFSLPSYQPVSRWMETGSEEYLICEYQTSYETKRKITHSKDWNSNALIDHQADFVWYVATLTEFLLAQEINNNYLIQPFSVIYDKDSVLLGRDILDDLHPRNTEVGKRYHDLSIIISDLVGPGLEIIKHYNPNIVKNLNRKGINIFNLAQEVYEVTWGQIKVTNRQYENDRCDICDTPLYEDIYLLLPNKESNIARAACPVCLHSNFNVSDNKPVYYPSGFRIYDKEVIVRTVYPRTMEEILPPELSPLKKEVLLASREPKSARRLGDSQAVYFGSTPEGYKYLLWTGRLSELVSQTLHLCPSGLVIQGFFTDY